MALSLGGGGRRRWSCRAARRGNGGSGCRHFHVHYHIPRQVWAFSPPRLPAVFLLLPFLLILPVLFLAVLAFLVCFGWFTLVYLASSLWSRSVDRTGDANEFAGKDEREERPEKLVTEHAGHFGLSDVCVEGKDIKEVGDRFSEESVYISRMASTGICVNDDEEKIVTEVTMLEGNWKGLRASSELDGSTEKHYQLVMDTPIDCFLEELRTKEFSTSINNNATTLIDALSIGEVFEANTKEISVLSSTEVLKFLDKHDTAEILVNGDGIHFVIPDVTSSYDSSCLGHGDEYREIKQEQSPAELSVNIVSEKLPEDVTDDHNHKQPEAASNEEYKKQIVRTSDEPHDSVCEMVGLLLDSVSENISENATAANTPSHQTNSGKDIELQEDLIQNKKVESSTSASAVCDFADNHWQIIEELDGSANEENVHKEGTSVQEIDNYASMGPPRRLPLFRRPPAPWWNLCGVLDVFAAGED